LSGALAMIAAIASSPLLVAVLAVILRFVVIFQVHSGVAGGYAN
jgi:hypothetical protein